MQLSSIRFISFLTIQQNTAPKASSSACGSTTIFFPQCSPLRLWSGYKIAEFFLGMLTFRATGLITPN